MAYVPQPVLASHDRGRSRAEVTERRGNIADRAHLGGTDVVGTEAGTAARGQCLGGSDVRGGDGLDVNEAAALGVSSKTRGASARARAGRNSEATPA